MKRISLFLMAALLAAPRVAPAQDAATEERLNKLSAQIEDLIDIKEQQNKKIEALESQVRDLQNQISKPTGNYASADDLKQVADAVKEVDRKRQDDSDKVVQRLEDLRKALTSHKGGSTTASSGTSVTPNTSTPVSNNGFEYTVKANDTLAAIVKAYRDNGVKVTLQQVLAANPGLDEKKLKVGQKIFIPKPGQ